LERDTIVLKVIALAMIVGGIATLSLL